MREREGSKRKDNELMKQPELNQYRVDGGFLVRNEGPSDFANRARALDARRRTRDEGEDDPEEVLEIHNHIPMSAPPDDRSHDGEELEEGEEVGRFPANQYHFVTDGDDVVIYKGAGTPKHKTDIFDVNDMSARDSRSRAPRTLRELNASNAAHYRQKAGRR
jgi:hypothetical protein